MLKRVLPTPEFLEMTPPSTMGLPAVAWTVVTPDVMLYGKAEYACTLLLN